MKVLKTLTCSLTLMYSAQSYSLFFDLTDANDPANQTIFYNPSIGDTQSLNIPLAMPTNRVRLSQHAHTVLSNYAKITFAPIKQTQITNPLYNKKVAVRDDQNTRIRFSQRTKIKSAKPFVLPFGDLLPHSMIIVHLNKAEEITKQIRLINNLEARNMAYTNF